MKKSTWQIIFSGVGGQGLLLSGSLLGAAAAIHEGKQAVMTADYGSEARGSFTKADLIISGGYIAFPEVVKPDVIVALAGVAYDRYAETAEEGTLIIYNSDQAQEKPSRAKQVGLPFDEIAASGDKRGGPVNMASLGALVELTGEAKAESVELALRKRFADKEKVAEANIRAFHRGAEAARAFNEK